jgi:hypothetical protein
VLFHALHTLAPQRRERLLAEPLSSAPLALPHLPETLLRLECPRLANLVRPLPAMRRLRTGKNRPPPRNRWQFQMAKAPARIRRLPLPRLPRAFLQRITLSSSSSRSRRRTIPPIPHRLIPLAQVHPKHSVGPPAGVPEVAVAVALVPLASPPAPTTEYSNQCNLNAVLPK